MQEEIVFENTYGNQIQADYAAEYFERFGFTVRPPVKVGQAYVVVAAFV